MINERQNEVRQLAGNEIDAVAGGGYIPQRIGFGVKTDTMIALQSTTQLSLYQVPTLP
jgi:hypothetical protein